MRMLKKLTEAGKGIVTVMHDLPLAFDFSDTVAVLRNGMAVAHATPSDMCEASVIHEIFDVKMKRLSDRKFYYDYE